MIYDYEIKKSNNEEILYLYFDFNSEFASFNSSKKEKLRDVIRDYIKENKIKYTGEKIAIVVGGLLVATVVLNNYNPNTYEDIKYTKYSITVVDTNTTYEEPNEEIKEEVISKEEVKKEVTEKSVSKTKVTNTKKESSTVNKKEQVQESTPEEVKTYVTIKRKTGELVKLELEEYVIGVVGAEMPASFHSEALKAQAVIARTYALNAIENGKQLTDDSSTQNYKDNSELQKTWGSSYNTYYNKIKSAVKSTEGMYLTYKGKIVDAVYHSTSNGMTEDAKYVWGKSEDYLVPVESPYDNLNSSFIYNKTFGYDELSEKLGFTVTPETIIEISSKTSGDRAENILIGDKTYTGVALRGLLGLRSADFTITKDDTNITFTTKGYGHGVGLSQYGANGYAKNGYTYDYILKHYYPGVTITK